MQHPQYDHGTYGQPMSLSPGGTYNQYEHPQKQYYHPIPSGMNTTEAQQNDRYQNTLTAAQTINRYLPEHQSSARNPHLGPPGSSSVPYGTQSAYPYNSLVDQHTHSQFIPTPSEIVQYSRMAGSRTPGHPPEPYVAGHDYGRSSVPRTTTHITAPSGPRTVPVGSPTVASGERFPCEKCGKTFSRSHDRKRHHETQHLPTPVIHRCRFCEKEFSRSDSLKRHVDNGCDEMP